MASWSSSCAVVRTRSERRVGAAPLVFVELILLPTEDANGNDGEHDGGDNAKHTDDAEHGRCAMVSHQRFPRDASTPRAR